MFIKTTCSRQSHYEHDKNVRVIKLRLGWNVFSAANYDPIVVVARTENARNINLIVPRGLLPLVDPKETTKTTNHIFVLKNIDMLFWPPPEGLLNFFASSW